jgi:hypothetical protein
MKRIGLWALAVLAGAVVLGAGPAEADGFVRVKLHLPTPVDGDPEDPQGTLSGPADSVIPDSAWGEHAAVRVSRAGHSTRGFPIADPWRAAILYFLELARRAHWIPGR